MTPFDESRIIATRTLDGLTPLGQRTRVFVKIGMPYAQGNGFRCPVRIEGMRRTTRSAEVVALRTLRTLRELCRSNAA